MDRLTVIADKRRSRAYSDRALCTKPIAEDCKEDRLETKDDAIWSRPERLVLGSPISRAKIGAISSSHILYTA